MGHMPSISEQFNAGQYAEVVAEIEQRAGALVDISVIIAYAASLERVGREKAAVDVLLSLHDASPCEALAANAVAAMCRLSVRNPEAVERLSALYPGSIGISAGKSEMALQDGDLQTGFGLCENRWAATKVASELDGIDCLRWDGRPFVGALLVAAEQGLGEEILFSCMFDEIPPATISCDKRLMPLFERSFPRHKFVEKGTLKEHITSGCQAIEAMELGKIYRATPFVNRESWLVADARVSMDMEGAMRQAFPGRKLVGLSWASRREGLGDSKSIPVHDLLPLLESGHAFWSLQYGDHSQDLAWLKDAGHDLYGIEGLDLTNDIDGVAALISALDVVVTCSNTVAHLAGALGKRTILMAPGGRFVLWYWGLDGDRTPWYPSVEIMRGPPRKGWAELAEQVRGMV